MRIVSAPIATFDHNSFVSVSIKYSRAEHTVGSKKRDVLEFSKHAEPDFNRSVDHKTGYRTKAIMCVPIQDIGGRVIAALQVINKVERPESDGSKESRLSWMREQILNDEEEQA